MQFSCTTLYTVAEPGESNAGDGASHCGGQDKAGTEDSAAAARPGRAAYFCQERRCDHSWSPLLSSADQFTTLVSWVMQG